jgi:hypothetical protein
MTPSASDPNQGAHARVAEDSSAMNAVVHANPAFRAPLRPIIGVMLSSGVVVYFACRNVA